jgi:hypothetical protein
VICTVIGSAIRTEPAATGAVKGRRADMANIGGPEDGPVVGFKVATTMHAVVRCLRHAHTLRGLVMSDSTYVALRKYVFGVLAKKVCCACSKAGSGVWLRAVIIRSLNSTWGCIDVMPR